MDENKVISESPEEETLDELLERINSSDSSFESFIISSDIGKDDYRAFLYYSVLGKNKIITACMIIVPAVLTFYFNVYKGTLMLTPAIVITIILWLLIFGAVILRTEKNLKKIGKNNPEELRLTRTEYKFVNNAIIHTKNNKSTRVPYKNLTAIGKTKKHFFLYFQGRKGMIIRCEDILKEKSLTDFNAFIVSKFQ